MVRLIIDYLGFKLEEQVMNMQSTIFLVLPDCEIPDSANGWVKELADIDSIAFQENYFLRTSDECLRGVVIGKMAQKYPDLIIYSSRPEVISRYLTGVRIEPWPNDLASFKASEKITVQGPKVAPPIKIVPTKNLVINDKEPKPLVRSFQKIEVKKTEIREKKIEKNVEIEEEKVDVNCLSFQNDLREVTQIIIEKEDELSQVSSYSDLQGLVYRTIREYSKKNPEIIESDTVRLKLSDMVCGKIFEFGFYDIAAGVDYRAVISRQIYSTILKYTNV